MENWDWELSTEYLKTKMFLYCTKFNSILPVCIEPTDFVNVESIDLLIDWLINSTDDQCQRR